MRTLGFLIVIFFFFSCKKQESLATSTATKSDSLILVSDSATNGNAKKLKIDTVFFSYDEKTKLNDYALISVLDKKYTEDSIASATFKIDFMFKKQLVYSHQLKVKNIDNGSEWYGNLELDSISSTLKTITLGYPACGYLQREFLFYINPKTKSALVNQWESMSDSGWGTWSRVISGKQENFIFRTTSFSPKDDEIEEIGRAEYSDSIEFKLVHNRWIRIYKTPKGKVYRNEIKSFDAFHKIDG
ncbi:hypothetical protein EQG63_03625 [Flavobacterium amnicola]|uniref:Lipoprotein n=1 Tax=Flavobacterium amnicola TaxID=2506422 RepID=A0A4Q1K5H0_9FLAO|nr:hypothetical protein [Flavobacterium amnicola]RXR21038.1 hypothetical protein EQG63_03625 [Flavobacterium amnicola]